jgi:hypothetical protein
MTKTLTSQFSRRCQDIRNLGYLANSKYDSFGDTRVKNNPQDAGRIGNNPNKSCSMEGVNIIGRTSTPVDTYCPICISVKMRQLSRNLYECPKCWNRGRR